MLTGGKRKYSVRMVCSVEWMRVYTATNPLYSHSHISQILFHLCLASSISAICSWTAKLSYHYQHDTENTICPVLPRNSMSPCRLHICMHFLLKMSIFCRNPSVFRPVLYDFITVGQKRGGKRNLLTHQQTSSRRKVGVGIL